jgi:uncharacterized membrane protein YhaH (DUF805 family)
MFYSWKFVFKNLYHTFKSIHNITLRLGRFTFILAVITVIALTINIPPMVALLGGERQTVQTAITVSTIIGVILIILLAIQRIHDVGFTAATLLTAFIPYIGLPLTAVLLFIPGETRTNKWGEPTETLTLEDLYRKTDEDDLW